MEFEYIYYDFKCICSHKFTVKATIWRGFSDHEDINCPKCGTLLDNVRADMGFEIIETSE